MYMYIDIDTLTMMTSPIDQRESTVHDELVLLMHSRIAAEEALEISRINLIEAQIQFNIDEAKAKKALRDEKHKHKQLIKMGKGSSNQCTIS